MNGVIPVWLDKTWKEAYLRYGWEKGVEGFCVEYNMLRIAEMSNKNVQFSVLRRSKKYVVSPEEAKLAAKQYKSFFTSRAGKVVAVIPANICEVVN